MPDRHEATSLREEEEQDSVEHRQRMLEQDVRGVAASRTEGERRQQLLQRLEDAIAECTAHVQAVPGRKGDCALEQRLWRRERFGADKTPERRLSQLAFAENADIELEIVPRPCAAGVNEPQRHSVAAEGPPRIRPDTAPDSLAPGRGQWLVVADDDGGRLSRFSGNGRNQTEHAPLGIGDPPRGHESESAKERNEERVRDGAHAGRRTERRNRRIDRSCDGSGRYGGDRDIAVERWKQVVSEGRRDQPSGQPGNDGYHAISENAGRSAAAAACCRCNSASLA